MRGIPLESLEYKNREVDASNSNQPLSNLTSSLLKNSKVYRKMSSSIESSALFTPLQVGRLSLSHRIVLAPLTRTRANKDHVHTKLGVDYYAQRSSFPGSLLVTEATAVHPAAGALLHAPYIYTDAQVQAWKKVRLVPIHQ